MNYVLKREVAIMFCFQLLMFYLLHSVTSEEQYKSFLTTNQKVRAVWMTLVTGKLDQELSPCIVGQRWTLTEAGEKVYLRTTETI